MSNIAFLVLTSGLLYLGPETIMPLASILAAIVGVILIFWRYITGFLRRIFRRITGKKEEGTSLEDAIESSVTIAESTTSDPNQQNE